MTRRMKGVGCAILGVTMLSAAWAAAQTPSASPGSSAGPVPSAGKPHERGGPGDMPGDRLERRRKQLDWERAKMHGALHGRPMTEALKDELQMHARRLARLERVKAVALEAKDSAVVDRVNKLIEMENARHDRFVSRFDDKADDDAGSREERGHRGDGGRHDDREPRDDAGHRGHHDDRGRDDRGHDDDKGHHDDRGHHDDKGRGGDDKEPRGEKGHHGDKGVQDDKRGAK